MFGFSFPRIFHLQFTKTSWLSIPISQVKRSRLRRITDPSTPDMRVTSLALDPLAHLCSPMSPLRLDHDASDGEATVAPLMDGAPVEPMERKRRKAPPPKKLKDTDLLEPVVVHSDAEDVD